AEVQRRLDKADDQVRSLTELRDAVTAKLRDAAGLLGQTTPLLERLSQEDGQEHELRESAEQAREQARRDAELALEADHSGGVAENSHNGVATAGPADQDAPAPDTANAGSGATGADVATERIVFSGAQVDSELVDNG